MGDSNQNHNDIVMSTNQDAITLEMEEHIRRLYMDLIAEHNKHLESNSEDEGDSDEERQRYLEKKAIKDAEDEAKRLKPKRKTRKKKGKSIKSIEDSVDEDEVLEFSIPEGNPFDPAKPVHTRMQWAIQMFRRNHRFTPLATRMFSMYLTYGAMDEADQLSNDLELEVDIEYVVASFLSHFIIQKAGIPDDTAYSITPRVLNNFFHSLRSLNALPEYEAQIEAALQITKTALDELPLIKAINTDELPYQARFHTACYELFVTNCGISTEELAELARIALADNSNKSYGDDIGESVADYTDLVGKLGKETRLEDVRVVRKILPIFMNIEAIDTDKVQGYGALRLTPFVSTDLDEEDQTETKTTIKELEIFLPADLARKMRPGMKMDGTFYELSNAIWFGEPLTLFPSYFRRMVEE